MPRIYLIITFAVIFAMLTGCAPVISKGVLDQVDTDAGLGAIRKEPVAYAGGVVLLGGTILGVDNQKEATVIEVLQTELDGRLKPMSPKSSSGRFHIRFEGFVDPAVYSKGRLITVVSKLIGAHVGTLGRADYIWPVVTPLEHHLWRPDPGVRLGIGLGIGIGN